MDGSDPTYDEKFPIVCVITPTAVGGYFKSGLRALVTRPDLNHPPTAVGGIQSDDITTFRLDLNYPPTAVGGFG